MRNLKKHFLLDPTITFLNHGSFGATPRPVFEAYQQWQNEFELEPVQFVDDHLPDLFRRSRQALGLYINANMDDVVFVPNATFGVNVVARSLKLGSGDEVLATDHEYGACNNVWQYLSAMRGFRYVQQNIPLPAHTHEEIVEQLWHGVTPRTRVIFVSHISSPTALIFPIEAICRRAREAGILTLIDGAHAPGQLPLDMAEIGADFYTGNGHKWLCSPKGSAFLYTARDKQPLIEPLVVGWGWGEDREFSFGSDYLDYLQWLGTNDVAAYLAVPDAIRFQEKHHWPEVRAACNELALQTVERICGLTGMETMYPANRGYFEQMAIAPLPLNADLKHLKRCLFEEYRIEIPCVQWGESQFIRVSVQGYNSQEDIDRLLVALERLLGEVL